MRVKFVLYRVFGSVDLNFEFGSVDLILGVQIWMVYKFVLVIFVIFLFIFDKN